ncbi:uncharacterized protein LOC125450444 [Stegostoma tigrinum]|uniref:uncharacterized protein LOC125450444 n=1 Tax=Stegostoma tigrinum TaxID=3053191 RepID=UPI00202AF5C3|nr:uncharacterized protein LOC125450444 [Stegostoma tigrinum]
MDSSVSREAEELRSLGPANGVGVKYRRTLDGGGGGGGGAAGGGGTYYRPLGRSPGEGGYHRPVGGYSRVAGKLQPGDGRVRGCGHVQAQGDRRSFGRRFDRKPAEGSANGFARRWKPRPLGRGCPGSRVTAPRHGEGRDSPASPDDAEGSGGAGEEEEEDEEEVEEPQHRWALFKPPAAFPIDSSSARISYASKLKENLSVDTAGTGQACDSSETGPRLGQGLRAIFHNQWGLSFITEPGTGSDGSRTQQRAGLNCQQALDPGRLGGPSPETSPPANRLSPDCEQWRGSDPLELQDVVRYFSREWDRIWERHKREPSVVVLYEESPNTTDCV